MQRTGVILAVVVTLFALALPALASGPEWPTPGPPPHGHMLLLANGQCVDLAASQVVPRNAQHAHLHVGAAGDAQELAGHAIVPAIAWDNCADFMADLAD